MVLLYSVIPGYAAEKELISSSQNTQLSSEFKSMIIDCFSEFDHYNVYDKSGNKINSKFYSSNISSFNDSNYESIKNIVINMYYISQKQISTKRP